MKRLLIVLGVLVALLVVVDVGARIAVERISAQELEDAPEIQTSAVTTSVDSFPFLGRLLFSGETSFSISLEDVVEQDVRVDRIEFDVDGLVFDRGEALDRRVRIDDVDQVRATVVVEEATITDAVGVDVQVEPGSITAGGVQVSVGLVDRTLQVGVEGIGSASIRIPSTSYLPCEPRIDLAQDRVLASCTTDALPPLVNDALGQVNP